MMETRTEDTAKNRRLIYYLSILGFFAIFSTTISKSPVLPLFATGLGSDAAFIGLIAAFSPLAGMLFSFPIGVLSDNLGRKKLLVASGAVFLTAPLLYLIVQSPVALIPIRFFHGFATAILGPVVSAIIAERFTRNKGEMLGIYSSATLVGRTIAPLAGGAIIGFFAAYPGLFEYHAVYLAAFAASIPVFALVLFYKEERHKAKKAAAFQSFKKSFVSFFSNRSLRATALVDMATYFTFGSFETYMPLLMVSEGFSAYYIGLVFSIQVISIALTKPLFGKWSDRTDRRIQIAIGLLMLGGSVAMIPVFPGLMEFIALSMLAGLGMSLSTVATSAFVADIAKKEELGASMGALSSIMDVGQSFGPVVTGAVIASFSYTAGFMSSLVVSIAVAVFFLASVYKKDLTAAEPKN